MENTIDCRWFWLFIPVTVFLMVWELKSPMAEPGEIRDLGHNLFDRVSKHSWICSNCAAFLNNLLLGGCIVYTLIDITTYHRVTLLTIHLFVLFWLRFVIGKCTALPKPQHFLPLSCELGDKNFFFLFSAHTATIMIVALHITGKYGHEWWGLFVPVLVFQTIRLLATKGHYTADIILALALSIFLYN